MPRITRKQQKIFASAASNNGVFGSLQGADPTLSSDPDAIQGRTAYANGWNDATFSSELLPPLEEFQALQYLFSRQIAYIMQEGIPEWDTSTTYYKGNMVKVVSGDDYTLFESVADNNTGNLTSDTTKWKVCGVSQDFNTGIHFWRADVTYGLGDWVRGVDANGSPDIFQSLQANNKGNDVNDLSYWSALGVGRNGFPLLSCLWSEHQLNETNWLRSDTWSWQDGNVYKAAYNMLEDQYTDGTQKTDTYLNANSFGTLTNNNGIISGFSNSNYLNTTVPFNPVSSNWEINLKIKTGNSRAVEDIFNSMDDSKLDYGMHIQIENTGKLRIFLSSDGATWFASAVTGSTVLALNTTYYIRMVFNGSSYVLYLSTTGEFSGEETTDITVSSSATLYSAMNKTFIGKNGNPQISGEYVLGSVDLTNCSFSYDGVTQWTGCYSLQYTEGQNGMKIVSSANSGTVEDIYNEHGVAWYYVLDTANQRFKLPRTKYGFAGLRDEVGKYVPESLPNLKGRGYDGLTSSDKTTSSTTGAFGVSSNYSGYKLTYASIANSSDRGSLDFDASRSSPTYQENASVQQRATQMYLYFYVGNTVRNQTEIDVGEITEALNKKWDSSNMVVTTALPADPQTGVFYFIK